MKIAECSYCKKELEIDESYDIDVENIYKVINKVVGGALSQL